MIPPPMPTSPLRPPAARPRAINPNHTKITFVNYITIQLYANKNKTELSRLTESFKD
jgi:hypothetical protein